MINLFTGYDRREAAGWHVFAQSVIDKCSAPIVICPLANVPDAPQGSNAFTFSRFLIPHLMGYQGWAIFVDGCDMLCKADIAELVALRDPKMAVQVVKHDYKTSHARKYCGTDMECANTDYERKNWASVMLINCGHWAWWMAVTPNNINAFKPLDLLGLRFIADDLIGALPAEWNWLADEHGENPDAKILHWTAGVPGMEAYKCAPHALEWFAGLGVANGLG